MLMKLIERFKKVKHIREKKKIITYGIILLVTLFTGFKIINDTLAFYQSQFTLKPEINRALYVFNVGGLSFNIDPEKIIPSDTPYEYTFSVSNYNNREHSDLDLEYSIIVKTTTNLPLAIELYDGTSSTTTILDSPTLEQDEDGAWYRIYKSTSTKTMNYRANITDTYKLSVLFPKYYSQDTTYAEAIENIEITIKSQQII